MTIGVWKEYLGFGALPSFDEIHHLETEKMVGLYFVQDTQLQGFLNDLLADIIEPYPSLSMRVEGPPGWGKTSFFYYMAALINRSLKHPRYLKIINATSFASFRGINHNKMLASCVQTLEDFVKHCCSDRSLLHDIQEREDREDKWKIDFYLDYLTDHRHRRRFNKSLIIVLDGVDTIPEQSVGEISIELFNTLNTSHIIKWLAIRDIVFKSYSEEIKSCLKTHFPHRREFPRIPLHGIIEKRIKSCGKNPINPFSSKLCYVAQNFSEGDNRIGLAILKSIMSASHPSELAIQKHPEMAQPKASQEAIEKLFEGKSLKIILDNDLIPNIFKSYANINNDVPLAKEVFSLLACLQLVDNRFGVFISKSISSKLTQERKKIIEWYIPMNNILDSVVFLEEENLVSVLVQKPLTVAITKKGELTIELVNSELYIDACKESLEKSSLRKQGLFWRIASVRSDFEDSVRKELYGERSG